MSKMLEPYFKQNAGAIRDQRSAIEQFLKTGPNTISAIAESTGYKKDLILWNLLGMMRWGSIEIASEEGEELTYALKEV
jgi:hypothetical protein